MKSLIIGGAGFVGGYLIQELEKCGDSIVVTKLQQETVSADHVKVVNLELSDAQGIRQLLTAERPDFIYHLAVVSSVALSWKNPELTVDVNIKGTLHLLDAIRTLDYAPRTLLIGSGEEYGAVRREETPIREDNRLRPGNIYAVTKLTQNLLGTLYAQAYQLDLIMVRAFNHIGPGQAPAFVVADFAKQIAEIEAGIREPVMKVGNLAAKRDFTDVRDVVRGYASLTRHGKRGETYNVGSGNAVSIEAILNMLLSFSKEQIAVEIDPVKFRPIDVPMIEADITKLQHTCDWAPAYRLQETLLETLFYWREKIRNGQ